MTSFFASDLLSLNSFLDWKKLVIPLIQPLVAVEAAIPLLHPKP